MNANTTISEKDFTDYQLQRVRAVARDLARTGLKTRELARLTGLKWDTIRAAEQSRPIRLDCFLRIEAFLLHWEQTHPAEPHTSWEAPATTPMTEQQPQPDTPPRGKGGKFVKKEEAK